ncbi:MAG: radical SAM protein [Candidatus Helarchaeota archaeon]
MQTGRSLCVFTNGCPENRIDGALMQEFLRENGWTVTSDYKDADLVLFNACGLTQGMEEHSIKIIHQIKAKKKSSAELIVWGCLPKINKDGLREFYQGFTFGHDIERISEVIKIKTNPQDIHANFLIPQADILCENGSLAPDSGKAVSIIRKIQQLLTMNCSLTQIAGSIITRLTRTYHNRLNQAINASNPHTFHIKVSTGCLNACSYCGVKLSRGALKSKPIDKIVNEFEEGLTAGYTEFGLLGTDLGSYGRDQGTNLTALLRELVKRKGDYKIKLRNVQPRFLIEMMPELQEIFRCGKITHLGSAAQSGNNRILGLMNRGYRIEDFKEAILTLNRQFPEIRIRTQVMVAFPSETEEEFADTVRLLDEVSFNYAEIYTFQARPGTKAAKMEGQISQKVAKRRHHKLNMKSLFRAHL